MVALTRIVWAGDESPSKTPEQWKNDLKQLAALSRLVASKPSLLREKSSTKQLHELSAVPFGCESPDVSECLLSHLSIVLSQQSTGSADIFNATQGAAVHMTFHRATDVWSDKKTENNWDIVKKWTDAVGPAVLLAGALLLSQERTHHTGAALIGSGAGLILVGNLGTLGQLYGGVTDKQKARVAKKQLIHCRILTRQGRHTKIHSSFMGFLIVIVINQKSC